MQLSHTHPVASAVFDDPNLVSCAGLVPIAALAQKRKGPMLAIVDCHRVTGLAPIFPAEEHGVCPGPQVSLCVITGVPYSPSSLRSLQSSETQIRSSRHSSHRPSATAGS